MDVEDTNSAKEPGRESGAHGPSSGDIPAADTSHPAPETPPTYIYHAHPEGEECNEECIYRRGIPDSDASSTSSFTAVTAYHDGSEPPLGGTAQSCTPQGNGAVTTPSKSAGTSPIAKLISTITGHGGPLAKKGSTSTTATSALPASDPDAPALPGQPQDPGGVPAGGTGAGGNAISQTSYEVVTTSQGLPKPREKVTTQLPKYFGVSFTQTFVELGVFAVLEGLGMNDQMANVFAIVCSATYGFTMNRNITFKSSSNFKRSVILFILLWCWNLTFCNLCLTFLPGLWGWDPLVIKMLTMACQGIWGFLLGRNVIFR